MAQNVHGPPRKSACSALFPQTGSLFSANSAAAVQYRLDGLRTGSHIYYEWEKNRTSSLLLCPRRQCIQRLLVRLACSIYLAYRQPYVWMGYPTAADLCPHSATADPWLRADQESPLSIGHTTPADSGLSFRSPDNLLEVDPDGHCSLSNGLRNKADDATQPCSEPTKDTVRQTKPKENDALSEQPNDDGGKRPLLNTHSMYAACIPCSHASHAGC